MTDWYPPWGRSEKEAYKAGIRKGRAEQLKEDAMMYLPISSEDVPLTTPAKPKAKKLSAEDRLIAAIDTLTSEIKKTTELREKQLAVNNAAYKRTSVNNVQLAVMALQRVLGTQVDGVLGFRDNDRTSAA